MKDEKPIDLARNNLLEALGKTEPSRIQNAIENFEDYVKTPQASKTDAGLIMLAQDQKFQLETDNRNLFVLFQTSF